MTERMTGGEAMIRADQDARDLRLVDAADPDIEVTPGQSGVPLIEVDLTRLERIDDDVYRVRVDLTNERLIPTITARARENKVVRPDLITVDGKRIQAAEMVYYLLNKPKGVICTNADPQGRKKAIDLVDCSERIFCVGRLDVDTTGAIILTTSLTCASLSGRTVCTISASKPVIF